MQEKELDPISKKCIGWAISCFVVGALILVSYPWLFDSMDLTSSPGGNAVMTLGQLLSTALQWSLFPTGSALIGAAVVIQWLKGHITVQPKKS